MLGYSVSFDEIVNDIQQSGLFLNLVQHDMGDGGRKDENLPLQNLGISGQPILGIRFEQVVDEGALASASSAKKQATLVVREVQLSLEHVPDLAPISGV